MPTARIGSSFRITAGGSAIVETMFPGTAEEMLNVYHTDGDELVLTHYCGGGTQPRMRAKPTGDGRQLAFRLADVTNAQPDSPIMGSLDLTIGAGRLTAAWATRKGNAAGHEARFELARKS